MGAEEVNRRETGRALIVVSTLLLFAVRAAAQTANLVNNPGFETVAGATATGWQSFRASCVLDSTVSHSGRNSIQCVNQSPTEGHSAYQTVYVNQTEAAPVLLSGWSRAANVSGTADDVLLDLFRHYLHRRHQAVPAVRSVRRRHARLATGASARESPQTDPFPHDLRNV